MLTSGALQNKPKPSTDRLLTVQYFDRSRACITVLPAPAETFPTKCCVLLRVLAQTRSNQRYQVNRELALNSRQPTGKALCRRWNSYLQHRSPARLLPAAKGTVHSVIRRGRLQRQEAQGACLQTHSHRSPHGTASSIAGCLGCLAQPPHLCLSATFCPPGHCPLLQMHTHGRCAACNTQTAAPSWQVLPESGAAICTACMGLPSRAVLLCTAPDTDHARCSGLAEHAAAARQAHLCRALEEVARYQELLKAAAAGSEGSVPLAEHQRLLAGALP